MSASYDEVLRRLTEERKRLGLSQKDMAQIVHITQSNYSKVEKSLHRLSYEEVKYLSKAKIDVYYIFTGYRSSGKYVENLQQHTYVELCCFLGITYSLVVLNDCRANANHWKSMTNRVKYIPLILENRKPFNIFVAVRNVTGIRQKAMAEKLGVDIKKLRELEKDRCLPDSEIIWKVYNLFNISPAVILKDKSCLINEISSLLEDAEKNGVRIIDIINQI